MRIAFDAKRLFKNSTGLGNYSRTLLRNLARFYPEHNYTLYTPGINRSLETDYFLNNSSFQVVQPAGKFKSVWRSYGVADQFSNDGINLYHGLSHEIPLQIRRTDVRSLVTIHDLIFKVYPEDYHFIDRHLYNFKVKNSLQQADHIVAISHHTKEDIVNYYNISPDKITVIYQSIAPLFFQKPARTPDYSSLNKLNLPNEYLLYVGTVQKRKCLDILIKAYHFLRPEERLPLVVVGSTTTYEQTIMKDIAATGLKVKIIRIDSLKNNKTLKMLYEKATAFVYPSRYEGFGLPIVEAMLCKTPVITTTASSLPEAGGPNSLYVAPDNPEELARAIERVLNDTTLRNKMKESGDAYARSHFGAETTTRSMVNLYDRIMA